MAISGISINPPANNPPSTLGTNTAASSSISSFGSDTPRPLADKKPSESAYTPQPSTIVTLSAQAHKLSQSLTSTQAVQSQTDTTKSVNQIAAVTKTNIESVPKEANEAQGIQFMAGESRGGRISTYA